ncbi:MAG: hypothetical protein UY26_C0003G0045 [Candidatus Jorgensenbacteria bacterium GW2011_GWA1_48_13]|uniref:Uncharacterized protein n=1 Tax=Candidatus Jorgensenbacteria bacterium GW2011_GWB1_50_10 TaxID=1618665 RepID=A0A0G1W898_9BACT|nr:MAG: hypothetical protein UY26_C0003G0045 [Candidatus Jorgensenbacteria bacterium GW2011_GWA1_48_13]KKW15006.1 MAG: hypothetical protein UY55_C0002G0062 [Candidatus Jorgensenbacteria bacterium GW2011_GWB1_50_10]
MPSHFLFQSPVVYLSIPPMPRTNRKNFSEGLRKEIWKIFWAEVEKSKKSGPADFLSKFLTEEEKVILEKRLAALYFLKQGESLRETSKKADVARKTVIFIKRGLKKLNYKKKIYSKFPKRNKFQKYPASYGRGRWSSLHS